MSATTLVIGEALTDVIEGPQARSVKPGGSPANVAIGLARLGHDAELLSALGDDEYSQTIRAWVTAAGAVIHPYTTLLDRTSVARASLDAQGAATYDFDISWSIDIPDEADIRSRPLVHVGSLALYISPGAEQLAEIVRIAHEACVPITVDANARPSILGPHIPARERFERVAGLATVVKLSDEDCAYLYPGQPIGAVMGWLLNLGKTAKQNRVVIVTRGAEDIYFQTEHGHGVIGIRHTDVVDTIGAGDSFMAAFLATLLERDIDSWTDTDTVREAANFAVRCAAITVGREGADPPWKSEIGAP